MISRDSPIRRALAVSAKEQQAGIDMIANPYYHSGYDCPGHDVYHAAALAERCLRPLAPLGGIPGSVGLARAMLALVELRWRRTSNDPDGYGTATLYAIGRALDPP